MEPPMQSSSSAFADVPLMEWGTKAAVIGGVAAAASLVLFPNVNVRIGGVDLPGWAAAGLGAAGGALAADAAHQWVMPLIPHDQKWDHTEALALSVASAGLGTYAASNLIGGVNMLPAVGLGAAAYVAGDWAYFNLINNKNMIA